MEYIQKIKYEKRYKEKISKESQGKVANLLEINNTLKSQIRNLRISLKKSYLELEEAKSSIEMLEIKLRKWNQQKMIT